MRAPMRTVFLIAAAGGCLLLLLMGGAVSALLNASVPAASYRVTSNISYGTGSRRRLDVYVPAPPLAAPAGGYPVVVFFYGGSWNRGARQDFAFVGAALAARGAVAVIADYRLYPAVRYPDFLDDCAAAVAWTRREVGRYGGNPARLFVAGYSAGAYNAAMLALDSRWLSTQGLAPAMLAGWIGIAGPYDFLPIRNPDVRPVFFHPSYPPGTQPIDYVSARSPPAFLAAANHDSMVNPERNTGQMAQRLRAAGVRTTVRHYGWANHYTLVAAFAPPLRWLAPVLADVAEFVGRTGATAPAGGADQ